jgi:hypothetical protein
MRIVASVLPDFNRFGKVQWVADGFDIPLNLTVQDLLIAAAYVVGMFVVGFFFLRTREVAR